MGAEITLQELLELHLSRLVIHSEKSSPSLPILPPLSFFPSSGCVYLSEFSGYSARNSSCWPPLLPLSLPLLPLRRKGQTRDGKCRDGFFALAPVKLGSLLRAGNVFFHSPSGRIAISYECEPRNEEEDMHGYDG